MKSPTNVFGNREKVPPAASAVAKRIEVNERLYTNVNVLLNFFFLPWTVLLLPFFILCLFICFKVCFFFVVHNFFRSLLCMDWGKEIKITAVLYCAISLGHVQNTNLHMYIHSVTTDCGHQLKIESNSIPVMNQVTPHAAP